MGTYKEHATAHRIYLVVGDGAQAKGLEALHLDTVVDNVA